MTGATIKLRSMQSSGRGFETTCGSDLAGNVVSLQFALENDLY